MRPLFVCTQILNRYDCLRRCITSIEASTRRPDGIYIVDHGYDEHKVADAVAGVTDIPIHIITLEDPGCAHNANWFLRNVPEDAVGCGDDIEFTPNALGHLTDTDGDYVVPFQNLNPAACALMRQSCVAKVGYFDELISPGYLYFEDTDYHRRMHLAGVTVTVQPLAQVIHMDGGSQTHQRTIKDPVANANHHKRFRIAAANYEWKWGGPPFAETLTTPRPLPRPDGA